MEERAAIAASHRPGPLIVGIGGTPREDSSSERVLRVCLHYAESLGARTEIFAAQSLAQMPAFVPDRDREPAVVEFLDAVRNARGVLIVSPGYHGSMSGLIKNAIDYVEDLRHDQHPYLDGRPVGLVACAAGWQAAVNTLASLRSVVHALRGWPTPLGVAINTAQTRWSASDPGPDSGLRTQLETVVTQVIEFARAHSAAAAQLESTSWVNGQSSGARPESTPTRGVT